MAGRCLDSAIIGTGTVGDSQHNDCCNGPRKDGSRLRTTCFGGLGFSMPLELGRVEAIFRYPVKSIRGERMDVANLGWHGLEGDRRLALRRTADSSGFPWLTAGKLPDLLLFAPHREDEEEGIRRVRKVQKALTCRFCCKWRERRVGDAHAPLGARQRCRRSCG